MRIYFHCLEGNCGKLLQRILEFFFFVKVWGTLNIALSIFTFVELGEGRRM